jgi:D-3-phosphoglycerate dehydrogenase|tara:strand:- start:3737 stop:4684 length:948 start_codon:yes stop_codon:yes gene_type:complete
MKILANDGIADSGITLLVKSGHEVITTKVAQNKLADYINSNQVDVLLVRSATTARKELIDSCPKLKMIGRGGVGMDNIDVEYAKSRGLEVFNTPGASSNSVAELVFAHISGLLRQLHDSNRQMPLEGESRFKDLKKAYASGSELRGKRIGIIGFGRIGKAVGRIAFGVGMEIQVHDPFLENSDFEVHFADGQIINTSAKLLSMDEILKTSDIITLHIGGKAEIIGEKEITKMKEGSYIVNTSRGGVVNEEALDIALESKHLAGAAIDVFNNEPNPAIKLLMNPAISLTPHIGAATREAQNRIGIELASQIIALSK